MKRVGLLLFVVGVAVLLMSSVTRAASVHSLNFADVNGGGVDLYAANISATSQLNIGSSATISGIGSRSVTLSPGATAFSITSLGGTPIDTSAVVGSLAGFSMVDFFNGSTLVARALVTSKPDSVSVVPNPEPASLLLLSGSMIVGIGFLRRQRIKNEKA